jgi:hypothetical protein
MHRERAYSLETYGIPKSDVKELAEYIANSFISYCEVDPDKESCLEGVRASIILSDAVHKNLSDEVLKRIEEKR